MLSQTKRTTDLRSLNGPQFKAAFCYGIKQLSLNRDAVNAINVLPVPNGDTGDNIHKTLLCALSEMEDDGHIGNQAKQCARGALMGARGASGIILANFLIGFATAIRDSEKISIEDLMRAINKGCERVKVETGGSFEGSMANICSAINAKLPSIQITGQTLIDAMKTIYDITSRALKETRIKNALLSKMGINDAGAVGFFYIIEGMYRYALDSPLERAKPEEPLLSIPEDILVKGVLYTVEFLINNVTLPMEEIKKSFSDIGSSLLLAYEGGDAVKVLIRTTDPRKVFDRSSRFGRSTMIRVDDLIDEQRYFLSRTYNKDVI